MIYFDWNKCQLECEARCKFGKCHSRRSCVFFKGNPQRDYFKYFEIFRCTKKVKYERYLWIWTQFQSPLGINSSHISSCGFAPVLASSAITYWYRKLAFVKLQSNITYFLIWNVQFPMTKRNFVNTCKQTNENYSNKNAFQKKVCWMNFKCILFLQTKLPSNFFALQANVNATIPCWFFGQSRNFIIYLLWICRLIKISLVA